MTSNEKTNKTLQAIANMLYINWHRIKQTGLINGRMGIAIYLYHYARYSGQNTYEELADILLDEVIHFKKSKTQATNFSGGFSGIAWGLNYLIENKFMETEDNTVLDDLESLFLKNTQGKTTLKKNGWIDFFGIALYY
jgi:lantibiotic modifying enzyme